MVKAKKVTGKASAVPIGIGLGVLISLVLTLLGGMGVASLLAGESIGMEALGFWRMALQFIAAFAGAVVTAVKIKHQIMPMSLITGGGYFLTLLAMNALFFGGQYQGVLVTGLMILLGSVLAAWIVGRGGNTPKRKHKIPAYR
ncbi:MAG: hypothetical protein E7439_02635 [Ruminococcaceae bacterium]|nr:hypothetical protein [Oscillospiraceae bacterium]